MAEYDPYAGRRPALGLHGQVRGLRSRPGAPLAQPNLNQTGQGYGPLAHGAGTPFSNWDSLFYNRITQNNPLAPGRPAQPPGQQNNGGGPAGDPTGAAGVAGPTGGGASLETLASGGVMPHTQRWSQPVPATPDIQAGGGFITGDPQAIANKYSTGEERAMNLRNMPSTNYGYGWNSAFTQPGNDGE